MNWIKIKDEYEKAFNLLTTSGRELWIGYDAMLTYKPPHDDLYNERDLYDFFDSWGINPVVGIEVSTGKYVPSIYSKPNKGLIPFDKTFVNRKDAEDFVFLKAFDILERAL